MSSRPAARAAALARRVRRESPRTTAQRAVRRAYQRLGVAELDFPLLPGDVADSALPRPAGPPPPVEGPLTVGWICTPPGAGSGGHTTMFRMVQALELAGHRCVVLLYDRHGGDAADQARVVRHGWPWVSAEVRSADDGFDDLDACVATGWPTAHVLATRGPADLHKLYFIQDYEPFFLPRGSEHELAADSYRLGFTHIALGRMVRDRLRGELGVESHLVPFSCDTAVYSLRNRGPRSGVVFYAKRDVPRRGYRLAVLALERFHARHPDQEIHVYGDPVPDLPVPVTRHERLTPVELNELYNRCRAGLAMSFTNISLVAEEMLASGCVPVVNDSVDARADLDSRCVAWGTPTPSGIADALGRAVADAARPEVAAAAAASVRTDNWALTGSAVAGIVVRVVRGRAATDVSSATVLSAG